MSEVWHKNMSFHSAMSAACNKNMGYRSAKVFQVPSGMSTKLSMTVSGAEVCEQYNCTGCVVHITASMCSSRSY